MAKKRLPDLKIKDRVMDYLVQGLIVFASVFLAFWLTEVRHSQNTEKSMETALKNIAAELTYNHKRIEYIYKYYSEILEQLDGLAAIDSGKSDNLQGYQLAGWQGVQMPMLRSTAYQTLLNSGLAKDIPFKTLNALAFIYNLQSVVEKGDSSYIEVVIADPNPYSLKKIRHFFQIYAEVLPDIITSYQVIGKPYLERSGYHSDVNSDELKKIVEQRKVNFQDY